MELKIKKVGGILKNGKMFGMNFNKTSTASLENYDAIISLFKYNFEFADKGETSNNLSYFLIEILELNKIIVEKKDGENATSRSFDKKNWLTKTSLFSKKLSSFIMSEKSIENNSEIGDFIQKNDEDNLQTKKASIFHNLKLERKKSKKENENENDNSNEKRGKKQKTKTIMYYKSQESQSSKDCFNSKSRMELLNLHKKLKSMPKIMRYLIIILIFYFAFFITLLSLYWYFVTKPIKSIQEIIKEMNYIDFAIQIDSSLNLLNLQV